MKKFLYISFGIFCVLVLLLLNGKSRVYLNSLFTVDQKNFVKKYFFPYREISKKNEKIFKLESYVSNLENSISKLPLAELELDFKKKFTDLEIKKLEDIKLSDGYNMNKYEFMNGLYYSINGAIIPGTGYLDFHEDNLLILSARGILAYNDNIFSEKNFSQIKNNINNFIGLNQFQKSFKFSIKDLLVHKDSVFISFTEEIKDNCWNTSVIFGEMNYENIEFEKLFSSPECVHSKINQDGEFEAHQSGGRIVAINDENILLTIGDYRSRFLAQDESSVNGKIISININDGNYDVMTMGHRNPQGLLIDKEANIILETEHGPWGGDEINLIEIDKIGKDEIPNYGWAISSAGKHYDHYSDTEKSINKKIKYPLYNSHSDHGFLEPLKSFVPSIGISEIIKIKKDNYLVASMKDKSIYYFELKNKKVENIRRVEVFERVRDMLINKNKIYLLLEDTASIGIISLK